MPKRGHNKKGTPGYGRFIDSYRKTSPTKAKPASPKAHKLKNLKKVQELTKANDPVSLGPAIVTKFAQQAKKKEQDADASNLSTIGSNVASSGASGFFKALKGTAGYEQWLIKFREQMASQHPGATIDPQGRTPTQAVNTESHQAILNGARAGDPSLLKHPKIHQIADEAGMTGLHWLARRGVKGSLEHPYADKARDQLNRTPLHYYAEWGGDPAGVIAHPSAHVVRDKLGKTPLHVTAAQGSPLVLKHPQVGLVQDFQGKTPLHSAAYFHHEELPKHEHYDKVKDNKGRTPRHIFEGLTPNPVQKSLRGSELFQRALVFPNLLKSDPVKQSYKFNGISIKVEWPRGTTRKYRKNGKLMDGKVCKADYGYVADSFTPDFEELDVYVGLNKKSKKVFILLQKPTPWDVKNGFTSPEEKFCLGFDSKEEAEQAYKGSMPEDWFQSIRQIPWNNFVKRVELGKQQLKRAKRAQLIQLPPEIEGKNCGTCKYFEKDYCKHPSVLMPVTDRMGCRLWANPEVREIGKPEPHPEIKKAVVSQDQPRQISVGGRKQMGELGADNPIPLMKHDEPEVYQSKGSKLKKDAEEIYNSLDKAMDEDLEEFKKGQAEIKKYLEDLPEVTALQGSKEQGAVYKLDDSAIEKALKDRRRARLLMASKLKKAAQDLSRRFSPHKEVADNSFDSEPFDSIKKASEFEDAGILKWHAQNKFQRMPYRSDVEIPERTGSESSTDRSKVRKSLLSIALGLRKIPRFVFPL